MKLFLLSADASGQIDSTINRAILQKLPLVSSMSEADAVVVPISYFPNYKFNWDLIKINRPYLLVDFLEFGWDYDPSKYSSLLWNEQITQCQHLNTEEWERLGNWTRHVPPKMVFKRELQLSDARPNILPIEFPCLHPYDPTPTREEFNARPIEVFHNWGLSHPMRQRLHGEIFSQAHKHGIHVCDSYEQDRFEKNTWVTIHTPYYLRRPIESFFRLSAFSKITTSLPGCGQKCFRHGEIVNSVMALPVDKLAWSFQWNDEENCIRFEPDWQITDLIAALRREDLYDIFIAGLANQDRYRSDRFVNEYITPKIKEII